MQKLFSRYKQFIAGLVVGAVVIGGVALYDSQGSEPFQSVPYVIRDVNGDTLFKTPRFTILYRGVGGVNSASSMTIAGKSSGVSSLWVGGSGSISGYTGSDKGIDTLSLYDGHQGIATFFVAGHLFRVMDSASKLVVANQVVPLSSSTVPMIIVEKDQYAHVANSREAKAVLASASSTSPEYDTAAPPKW